MIRRIIFNAPSFGRKTVQRKVFLKLFMTKQKQDLCIQKNNGKKIKFKYLRSLFQRKNSIIVALIRRDQSVYKSQVIFLLVSLSVQKLISVFKQMVSFFAANMIRSIRILIIYFMSFSAPKLTEQHSSSEYSSEGPSTPRKKPRYPDEEVPTKRKVKSITKLIEKQSTSVIYSLLVLLWACLLCGAIIMSFQAKMLEVQNAAIKEVEKCEMDYHTNRCDSPVKGVVHYCNQKLACKNEDPKDLAERRISYMGVLGEISKEFLNGAGLIGIGVGVVLIWLSMRQKGLNRTITSVEYYQSQ